MCVDIFSPVGAYGNYWYGTKGTYHMLHVQYAIESHAGVYGAGCRSKICSPT